MTHLVVFPKGEPGELVGKIVKGEPLREFDGYADPEATKKKLTYDVFKKGDCYFLTGKYSPACYLLTYLLYLCTFPVVCSRLELIFFMY